MLGMIIPDMTPPNFWSFNFHAEFADDMIFLLPSPSILKNSEILPSTYDHYTNFIEQKQQ
ncbi:MAG: hypothetical protein FWD84_01640, partial [Oscillospiraceae bacterium]|nr:hypothetical protein [Oscillospiraceae bacterium]